MENNEDNSINNNVVFENETSPVKYCTIQCFFNINYVTK